MSDFLDVLRHTPLAGGSHSSDAKEACVMEKVSILWALGTGQDVSSVFSDLPGCTNYVISRAAQVVNDRLGDDERQALNPLIPRLLRARRTENDPAVNLHLAIWSAKSVMHLITDPTSLDLAREHVATAEAALGREVHAPDETLTPVAWLDALLDAWEEAASKAGEDIYIPQAWEDDALGYLA